VVAFTLVGCARARVPVFEGQGGLVAGLDARSNKSLLAAVGRGEPR